MEYRDGNLSFLSDYNTTTIASNSPYNNDNDKHNTKQRDCQRDCTTTT